jgi:hypothetical protein
MHALQLERANGQKLAEAIIFSIKNKIPIRPDRHFEHKAKPHSQQECSLIFESVAF